MDFSIGGDLDRLIENAAIVYLLAAPKAGGSSFAEFTKECVGTGRGGWIDPDDVSSLLSRLEMSKFFARHITTNDFVNKLIKETPRNALLIATYRDETDRLASAIKHVMGRVCQKGANKTITPLAVRKRKNDRISCILDEQDFVEKIIKTKHNEIGVSTLETFSCGFHDSLTENNPNIVMLSMNKLSDLMELLRVKYCPSVKVQHLASHIFAKNWDYYLKIKNGTEVEINEWLGHKGNFLEYILGLKRNVSCQGKSRQMEDKIMACPNEVIHNFY